MQCWALRFLTLPAVQETCQTDLLVSQHVLPAAGHSLCPCFRMKLRQLCVAQALRRERDNGSTAAGSSCQSRLQAQVKVLHKQRPDSERPELSAPDETSTRARRHLPPPPSAAVVRGPVRTQIQRAETPALAALRRPCLRCTSSRMGVGQSRSICGSWHGQSDDKGIDAQTRESKWKHGDRQRRRVLNRLLTGSFA